MNGNFESASFVRGINDALEARGKNVTFFNCSKIFPENPRKATTALAGHLREHDGLLGRFSVHIHSKNARGGILWKAVANDENIGYS